jgi:hypothetical protein
MFPSVQHRKKSDSTLGTGKIAASTLYFWDCGGNRLCTWFVSARGDELSAGSILVDFAAGRACSYALKLCGNKLRWRSRRSRRASPTTVTTRARACDHNTHWARVQVQLLIDFQAFHQQLNFSGDDTYERNSSRPAGSLEIPQHK